MEISQEVIRALLDAFDKSDWQEMTVSIGNDRLHVSRNGGAPPAAAEPPQQRAEQQRAEAPVPAPPPAPKPQSPVPSPQSPALPEGTIVESPSVGLFWRAPSPGAPPFVEVGKAVNEGDTLAIVEVMKLMNHVVAPVAGEIKAIVPENGEAVEYGQPLVVIG
jgi:acetyl-CoA carboxylase biotin carboxyl carrier protein